MASEIHRRSAAPRDGQATVGTVDLAAEFQGAAAVDNEFDIGGLKAFERADLKSVGSGVKDIGSHGPVSIAAQKRAGEITERNGPRFE